LTFASTKAASWFADHAVLVSLSSSRGDRLVPCRAGREGPNEMASCRRVL